LYKLNKIIQISKTDAAFYIVPCLVCVYCILPLYFIQLIFEFYNNSLLSRLSINGIKGFMIQSIDLTHTFSNNMPVYPGDPCAELYQIAEFHSDSYNDFKIETGMHVGTHIDAPMHMVEDGCYISEIDVNSFSGNGYLIDARNHNPFPPRLIDLSMIQTGDIVLIFTGFGSKFYQPNYFEEYPEFSQEFARMLVGANISMVGMDTPSPDRHPYLIHKLFFSENILIIENLTNLDKLLGVEKFKVYAFPLKLNSDASPARIIAEVQQ